MDYPQLAHIRSPKRCCWGLPFFFVLIEVYVLGAYKPKRHVLTGTSIGG